LEVSEAQDSKTEAEQNELAAHFSHHFAMVGGHNQIVRHQINRPSSIVDPIDGEKQNQQVDDVRTIHENVILALHSIAETQRDSNPNPIVSGWIGSNSPPIPRESKSKSKGNGNRMHETKSENPREIQKNNS